MSAHTASGRRPPELDDANWLRRRYESDGDMAIALDLGVSRGTVRRARERLGILGASPGPRRGSPPKRRATDRQPLIAALRIAERILAEQRAGGPPGTLNTISTRVRALHEADQAGDWPAIKDSLISLAAACGLMLDHVEAVEAL